jgi:hypothetical protein
MTGPNGAGPSVFSKRPPQALTSENIQAREWNQLEGLADREPEQGHVHMDAPQRLARRSFDS